MALVAGRNRVPRPATGKTAVRIGFMRSLVHDGNVRCGGGDAKYNDVRWRACWRKESLTASQPYMFLIGRAIGGTVIGLKHHGELDPNHATTGRHDLRRGHSGCDGDR